MAFGDYLPPAARAGMTSQRIPVSFQSSMSPDSVYFPGMNRGPPSVPMTKREPIGLASVRRLPQPENRTGPKAATLAAIEHPRPFQTSGFFIQEPVSRVAEAGQATAPHKPQVQPPPFQQFDRQDTAQRHKRKQLSPTSGSGRDHSRFAPTYRSPNHGRPGIVSHQVTSVLPKRTEPSHKHPLPSIAGSMRTSGHANMSGQSSPVPLGDLDHSLKGSPLLFTRQPDGRMGERQANRPMLPEPVVDSRSAATLRPNSRESNISKRRVNSSRLSFPFHGDEMADLEKFGCAWNHYLQNHARRSENASARIAALEQTLSEQTRSLNDYTRKCNHQSAVMSALEKQVSGLTAEKQKLSEEHQIAKKHLERNEVRREEMQSKLRSYRDKLNEAIREQQDLYKRSRILCDTAIDDVRKTQEEADATQQLVAHMLEEGTQRAADARQEMKALLEGELKKCQFLQNTVEEENSDLRKQLSDVQNELKGDKAKVQDLLAQLERQGPARDHLQSLESKSNDILLQLQQAKTLLPANEETHKILMSKLDVVLEQVQASATSSLEYSNLKESIDSLVSQLDSTSSQLLADVRSVLASQSSIVTMSSSLEKTINDQLSSVNHLIKEQEESLLNQLQDKDGKCQELVVRLSEKTSELKIAAENVRQVSRIADERNNQVEELHAKVQELQKIFHERRHLELENKTLLEKLSSKDTDHASLQTQLEDALGQNQTRAVELQNLTREIADRLQEKGADAADVSSLRTKMACKLEVERSKLDEAKRVLHKYEGEKSKLEKDFIDMASEKSKLSKDLEETRAHRTEERASLERTRVSLIQAEQRIINLKEKLRTSEFKTRDVQTALTQWAAKKKDGAELPEDFLNLDLDAMRILVRTVMDVHRESEAAKDCLSAVLEVPTSSPTMGDISPGEKPSCLPAQGQERGGTDADTSTAVALASETPHGTCTSGSSTGQGAAGNVAKQFPVDTTMDSVRRIIVQSPFDEDKCRTPPSVEEERMSRRRYARPLSILKNVPAPVGESGAMTPTSPPGQRANNDRPASKSRPRSLPPTYREKPGSTTGDEVRGEVDARAEGFLGKIKQSLGLQRTVSTDSGRKRKGSISEDANPAKTAKTWQSMFGTLDLEISDLKSSYFSSAAQPRRPVDNAPGTEPPRPAAPAGGNGSKTDNLPRGNPLGQQGRGKSRGIVRTYSKKPLEPGTESAP